MKKGKRNVTAQSIIIISVLLLIVNLSLGSVLLLRSKTMMKTLINNRMLDIANTSADMIDGDVLESLDESSLDSPGFYEIYYMLKTFQDNIDLEYIYTVRDMGDGTFTFTVDPAEEDSGEYGQPINVTDALITASGGISAVDDTPYTDSWGKFYSAYSPVFDSAGKVAGIVCVDFSAKWYDTQISHITFTVVLSSIISLLVGASVVFVLMSGMKRKLDRVNSELVELESDVDKIMNEFGRDDSSKTIPRDDPSNDHSDELGFLADKIRNMRIAFRSRLDETHTQANRMVTALSSDYQSVYYVDFDKNLAICYRSDPNKIDGEKEGEQFAYLESFQKYARCHVVDSDREAFLEFISPDNVKKLLTKENIIAHRYLAVFDGHEKYEMLRMAGVRHVEDRDDHIVHAVGAGFSDVDSQTREQLTNNRALIDALAQAEEASLAKTSFLSSMSHEIRTPMNAIIGLNSLALKDENLPDSTREYLEKIESSANHLLRLINDILDMSRIESGHMSIRNEVFSFSEIIQQINTMFSDQCRNKGIKYEFETKGHVSDYYIGDDMKLKQVIINILGNAVKFTPEGGKVSFIVENLNSYKDNTTLRFIISDTGIGMDEEFIPKIFETFSQEEENKANKLGSTGLGMAITKNIIDLMNGEITVESKKGVGTTFFVTLSLKVSEKTNEDAAADASEEVSHSDLTGKHILLAEDMEINAEIMMEVLDMRDMTADHAENGQIAVEMFSKSKAFSYDAILMDVRMPVMTGLEATEAIRSLDRPDAASVPIIALTANAFDEDVQRSLRAGMNAHLSKPVDPDQLFETLEKLIR